MRGTRFRIDTIMSDKDFDQPSYIVLNVPEPIAGAVKALRRRFDPERAELPVEVTVAGSGGLGTIKPGQDPEVVYKLLDEIALDTSPIDVRFGPMRRFPNTTIFFLDIEPDERIKYLQQRLIDSDIEFEPSPFPFEPHCTIKLRGATYIKDVRNMLSFKYQSAIVTLNTLSVYNHEEAILNPRLLHRANLGKLET